MLKTIHLDDLFRHLLNKLKINSPSFEMDQNPLKQSRFFIKSLTWGLIATTGLSLSWLIFAYTDEVVFVEGKLEPIGEIKNIQIPFGGVVKNIFVKPGQKVSEGEILIVLDSQVSKKNLDSFLNRLDLKRKQLRLKKLEKQKNSELYLEKIKILKERVSLENNLLNRFDSLLKDGAISEIYYLNQNQKAKEIMGELIENQKNLQRQELVADQEIKVISSELAELKALTTQAEVSLKYKSIKAPVDGIVFDLKPTSTGFVAKSSEPIMKILPFNQLEADVKIPSNKIGFVKVGMPAEISIDSYPAIDFATLKGKVKSISSDVIDKEESQNQKEFYFNASIALENQDLVLRDGDILPLQVGMSLTANIKLRRVSYLKLLLGTFKDKSESLKRI